MKRKVLWCVVVLLSISMLGAFSLSSCAPAQPTTETEVAVTEVAETKAAETEAAAKPDKIVVASEAGTGWTQQTMDWSKKWTEKTGINVEFAEIPFADLVTRYMTEFVAESGAYDVVAMMRPGWPTAFAQYLAPIDDVKTDEEWQDFFPIAKETNTFDGHIYAVPKIMSVEVLYYRTDLFDQYNVKVPTNWDELVEAGKKLTLDTNDDGNIDIWGLGFKGKNYLNFWPIDYIYQAGGEVIDANGNVNANSPEAVEAFQFLTDLINKDGICSPGSLNDEEVSLHTAFYEGKIAMLQNWNYMYLAASDTKTSKVAGKFATIPVPGKVREGVVGSGWNYAVTKDSKNYEYAKDWINFVTTPEADLDFCLNYETQPAHLSTFDNPDVKAKYGVWIDQLKKGNETAFKGYINPKYIEIQTVLKDAMQNAITKKMTPQEALDQAQTEIEKLLK
jgi:multiple sugar transport system substrate-binding protein